MGHLYRPQAMGLSHRRVVRETYLAHVGKEANKLEEVEAGLEHDPEVIYTAYHHPHRDPWRSQVLRVLQQMPQRELAEAAGLSVRRPRDLLTERAQPRMETKETLTDVAFAFARNRLQEEGMRWPANALAACLTYLQLCSSPNL